MTTLETQVESTENAVDTTGGTESSAHISANLVTYRTYGAFDSQGLAMGVKKEKVKNPDGSFARNPDGSFVFDVVPDGKPAVQSETQTHKNWEGSEANGATILAENAFKFYTLSDLAGFDTLVPSDTQRLYIIQKGIDALQSAAANRIQTELQEKNDKSDPDVYVHNGETIDLREALNTPPQKKALTQEEKLERMIGVMEPDKMLDFLEAFKRKIMAQASLSTAE